MSGRRAMHVVCLGAAAFALYAYRLGDAPVHPHHDEILFARQARLIGATGRDSNGRLLPLYFEMHKGGWFHPAVVYLSVPLYKVWAPTTAVMRLQTALVGAANVVLMYFVAGTLFRRDGPALRFRASKPRGKRRRPASTEWQGCSGTRHFGCMPRTHRYTVPFQPRPLSPLHDA